MVAPGKLAGGHCGWRGKRHSLGPMASRQPVRMASPQGSRTVTEDLVNTNVQLASNRVTTPIRECWKEGRMWPLVASVGSCGSTRVHNAEYYCMCPVEFPMLVVGANGLMLVQGAPLARYMPLDPLSNTSVSRKGSGAGKGVLLGAGLEACVGW